MSLYEVQTFNYSDDQWETAGTYNTDGDNRAEENAFFAYRVLRNVGPARLLMDGNTRLGSDDPDDYYRED